MIIWTMIKRIFAKNTVIPSERLVINVMLYAKDETGDTPKSAFTEKVMPNPSKNKPAR